MAGIAGLNRGRVDSVLERGDAMPKLVLLVVSDHEETRQLMERDLERGYGERYHVLGVASGRQAFETLRQSRVAHEPVALLLVDRTCPASPVAAR
jgi:CheY-like chemotaxis protein